MSCPNCKCKKNKKQIDKEEYEELKEYLMEEIKDFKIIDYINDKNKLSRMVEVEMEEHIVELEDIDTCDLTLDKVIDHLIINNMK